MRASRGSFLVGIAALHSTEAGFRGKSLERRPEREREREREKEGKRERERESRRERERERERERRVLLISAFGDAWHGPYRVEVGQK